jgi:hypothetical protein
MAHEIGVRSWRHLGPVRILARSGPAADPGSLDPSEAPERLCYLFNREGAFPAAPCFHSECEVVSRCLGRRENQRTMGAPLVTASHPGSTCRRYGDVIVSVHVIKALQRLQLSAVGAKSQGPPDPSHQTFVEGFLPCFPCEDFYPFEAGPYALRQG